MSQLPALLRTDLSQMAERVRRAGRGPDTMLAHITPKEAALLRAQGGSGTMNPMTGLPEFFDFPNDPEMQVADLGEGAFQYTPPPISQDVTQSPPIFDSGLAVRPVISELELNYNRDYPDSLGRQGQLSTAFTERPPQITPALLQTAAGTPGIKAEIAGLGQVPQANIPQVPFPSTKAAGGEDIGAALRAGAKNIGQFLQTPLGYGAIGALPAILQARRASKQSQQLQQELGRLGQEARTQGQELLQQARSGQITATQQQQLEAQRAAALQNLSRRGITGGTAVQQLEQSLQNQRGRFLEDTLNQGLRLINVGDQYTSQAIRAGYQADAQAQQLLGNFFNNYMRVLAGQAQPQSAPRTAP